jgi:formate dehydrogenase iron-sulfur subunit
VLAGDMPACAEACPTEATMFGDRDELLLTARKRIVENPGEYQQKIFGEREVGGTSMLYLAKVPFTQIGFNPDMVETPLPQLTWAVLSKIPDFVLVGGTFMGGIAWIINRRMTLEDERIEEAEKRRLNPAQPQEKTTGFFDRFKRR